MIGSADKADEVKQDQSRIKQVHLKYINAKTIVKVPETHVSIPYMIDYGMIMHQILLHRIAAHIRKGSECQKMITENIIPIDQKSTEKQQHFQNQHGPHLLYMIFFFHKSQLPFCLNSFSGRNLLSPVSDSDYKKDRPFVSAPTSVFQKVQWPDEILPVFLRLTSVFPVCPHNDKTLHMARKRPVFRFFLP